MGKLLTILGMILLCLFVSVLPGTFGLAARSLLLGGIGYYLFFNKRSALPTLALVTSCLVFELTGILRFGDISLVILCFWGSITLFSEYIRFTSPYARYLASLIVLSTLLALIGYPLVGFWGRLLILSITLIPLVISTLTLNVARNVPEYELA